MIKRIAFAAPTALLTLALCAVNSATAQVPSFAEITGHELGERITVHHEMVHLADPRETSPQQAASIIEEQPVILWYGGSIHGFELSGTEGLLKLLEHLTTRDDPVTMEVLQNAVILIDPILNPDGRDAFAHLSHQNIGRQPNPERDDWGNDFTGWQSLKFRTGHYYFDTNRDWFAHTQRETQARAPTIIAWRPQVVVDMHEMGSDREFFFDPGADPYAPYFPQHSRRWFQIFCQAYAAAFDSAGFEYITRELFDYFYPGYTTSFGDYQGAVGMLYEQGSSRGFAITRSDHSVRTLADAVEQQYVAAWTAARTSVARRATLLREYYDAIRADIADGRQGIRRYLIAPEGDPLHIAELANMLVRNGIEVDVLTRPARLSNVRDRTGRSAGARDFPEGTYVIEAAQPRNRLVRMLLEPDVPTPEEFLREARERVERAERARFYDITAWSLPLLFNVGGFSTSDGRSLPAERLTSQIVPQAEVPAAAPSYAYLIDGRQTASLSALYHLKARGYRAALIRKPSKIEGRDVASGTVIVRVGQNDETVHDAVRELAERFKLTVRGTSTGLSEPGFPVLGSADAVTTARTPEIAILAEDPIRGYSFGWAWYTLDQQYEIPVTVLRVGSLANRQLDRFNVLIVPSVSGSALASELGEEGVERIKRWVREGGTLVTIGSATEFARNQLELIDLRSWYDTEEGEDAQHFDVPGAIFQAKLNEHHWMSAGYDGAGLPVLVESDRIYLAPEGPPSSRKRVITTYGDGQSKLSGHAWQESLERLAGAVFAYEERVGGGRVIAFAEDINFRAYARGANRLFLNAVLLGPSAP